MVAVIPASEATQIRVPRDRGWMLSHSSLAMTVGGNRRDRHAAAKPRHAHRRHHRHAASRPVHRQSRHHPRSRDQDAADAALGEPGLDHLRLRIPGLAAQGDGRAELDRAVLSRRGDRVRGRASALLLLPPRRRQPVSRGVGEGQWRCGYSRAARWTPCCIASGWSAARSGCIRCRCRWRNCPTARWCRQGDGELSDRAGQGAAVVDWPAIAKADGALDDAMLLTPPSTLRALGAGYRPVLHPSAMSLTADHATRHREARPRSIHVAARQCRGRWMASLASQ